MKVLITKFDYHPPELRVRLSSRAQEGFEERVKKSEAKEVMRVQLTLTVLSSARADMLGAAMKATNGAKSEVRSTFSA